MFCRNNPRSVQLWLQRQNISSRCGTKNHRIAVFRNFFQIFTVRSTCDIQNVRLSIQQSMSGTVVVAIHSVNPVSGIQVRVSRVSRTHQANNCCS